MPAAPRHLHGAPRDLVVCALVPQFAMTLSLKHKFPLHFIVFKQTASHIPHEANIEQIFSRSGNLSDPNMDPHFLALLTKIGKNKAAYKPSHKEILAKYYAKFRGSSSEDAAEASPPATPGKK